MAQTFTPDCSPATEAEQSDALQLINALRVIRSFGGWGKFLVELKAGDISGLEITYTQKPRISQK